MPDGARSATTPKRIADEQRREKALQLRLGGATFQQIAEQCDYIDKAAAYRAVLTGLQRIGADEARELRDLDLARLDRLLMAVWSQAMHGELAAVDRVLAIIQRRARMLGYEGLQIDATVHAETTPNHARMSLADALGSDISAELEQQMARVLNDALPPVVEPAE